LNLFGQLKGMGTGLRNHHVQKGSMMVVNDNGPGPEPIGRGIAWRVVAL